MQPVGDVDIWTAQPEDEHFMDLALEQAVAGADQSEVPVGAVVVKDGQVVAARHNQREIDADPTAHAEVLALRDAADRLGDWHLVDCTLYVTLEPCLMCAGGALNARIARLVYGAADPVAGACLSLYNVCDDPRLNHMIRLTAGVKAAESARLLRDFFAAKR